MTAKTRHAMKMRETEKDGVYEVREGDVVRTVKLTGIHDDNIYTWKCSCGSRLVCEHMEYVSQNIDEYHTMDSDEGRPTVSEAPTPEMYAVLGLGDGKISVPGLSHRMDAIIDAGHGKKYGEKIYIRRMLTLLGISITMNRAKGYVSDASRHGQSMSKSKAQKYYMTLKCAEAYIIDDVLHYNAYGADDAIMMEVAEALNLIK